MRCKRSVEGEYGEDRKRTSRRREKMKRNLPRRGEQRRDRGLKRYKGVEEAEMESDELMR